MEENRGEKVAEPCCEFPLEHYENITYIGKPVCQENDIVGFADDEEQCFYWFVGWNYLDERLYFKLNYHEMIHGRADETPREYEEAETSETHPAI